jgi:hypothetical protein
MKRRKSNAELPQCSRHRRLMIVRRVVGLTQYRYCPVPGCGRSEQTRRTKPPRPRSRASVAQGAGDQEQGVAPEPVVAGRQSSPFTLCLCVGAGGCSEISARLRRNQKLSYTFR